MAINHIHNRKEPGFALLIALIVVGVVLSVGLTILDLSIKQVKLSTNAKESELAFQAANAGMECARFWRRTEASAMELGQSITPTCFGEATFSNSDVEIIDGYVTSGGQTIDVDGDGEVFQYSYSFTWGSSEPRCTQVDTLVASTSALGVGVTTTGMTALIPGYPNDDGTNAKYCEPGAKCSTISVRGYNRPCNTTGGYGVVQREVLLQF